jgi:uncharacterized membrane protein YjfL (UPF0719 family)
MGEHSLFVAGVTALLLVLLSIFERRIAPDLDKGTLAKRLLRAGELIGLFSIAAGAARAFEDAEMTLRSAAFSVGLAVVGLALLLVIGQLGHRLLLGGRLGQEVDRGNTAAGLAGGAHYASTGIIAGVALAAEDVRGALMSLAFFALGELTIFVVVTLFRALTTYDDAEQIAGENTAAAMSYAGVVIATAIVVARALEGEFIDWASSLKAYGLVVVTLITLYPVRQLFLQTLLLRAKLTLRGGRLDHAIGTERDLGLATFEAAGYIATALVLARLA